MRRNFKGYGAHFAFACLLLHGCAPDVQQQDRQVQREQVFKLTRDLGTPDQFRGRAQTVQYTYWGIF